MPDPAPPPKPRPPRCHCGRPTRIGPPKEPGGVGNRFCPSCGDFHGKAKIAKQAKLMERVRKAPTKPFVSNIKERFGRWLGVRRLKGER